MNHRRPRPHPAVPRTTAVRPGASVNIVLKADQPTGRTVSGVVRDVLTRGDHPRGIKVRLADGRVGRVQSMASPSSSLSGPPGGLEELVGALEGGEAGRAAGGADGGSGSRGGRPPRRGGRQVEEEEEEEEEENLPTQQVGLDAYVRQARPKRKRGRGGTQRTVPGEEEQEQEQEEDGEGSALETVTCPVCGSFEGDEAAVSHHVATHFDSAG